MEDVLSVLGTELGHTVPSGPDMSGRWKRRGEVMDYMGVT